MINKIIFTLLSIFSFTILPFSQIHAGTWDIKVLTEKEIQEYLKTIDELFDPAQYNSEYIENSYRKTREGVGLEPIENEEAFINLDISYSKENDLSVKTKVIGLYNKGYFIPEIEKFIEKHEKELYFAEDRVSSDRKGANWEYISYWDIGKLKIQMENEKQKSTQNINTIITEENAVRFRVGAASPAPVLQDIKQSPPKKVEEFLFSAPKPNQISLSPETVANNVFLTFLLIVLFEIIYKVNANIIVDFKASLVKMPFFNRFEKRNLGLKQFLKNKKVLRYLIVLMMFFLYGFTGWILSDDSNIDWNIYLVLLVVTLIYSLFEYGIGIYFYHKNKAEKILLQSFTRFFLLVIGVLISKYFSVYPALLVVVPLYLFSVTQARLSIKKELQVNVSKISTIFFVGITAWILSMYLQGIWGQITILLFTLSIQGLFYSIITNTKLYSYNRYVWWASLFIVWLVFVFTMINPDGSVISALKENNFTKVSFIALWLFSSFSLCLYLIKRFYLKAKVSPKV